MREELGRLAVEFNMVGAGEGAADLDVKQWLPKVVELSRTELTQIRSRLSSIRPAGFNIRADGTTAPSRG